MTLTKEQVGLVNEMTQLKLDNIRLKEINADLLELLEEEEKWVDAWILVVEKMKGEKLFLVELKERLDKINKAITKAKGGKG